MTVNSILGSTCQMPATLELPAGGQDGSAIATVQPTPPSGSANLVSRNFAAADSGGSRYLEATLSGLRANKTMKTSEQNALVSILQAARVEYANAETAGERYIALKRAEKSISYHQSDEVRKYAETHLKESREDIESRAEEALAPTDVNGQTIDVPGSGSTDLPMPEISGSGSSVPPPVSGSGGQASAPPAAVPSPTGSSGAASSAPSLDVVV